MPPILPGATLGILGGGQLGRMMALAARSLGYGVHALDPDPACPARPVVDRCVTAPFDDAEAAADLARGCDVVTLEIEKIGLPSLEAAARHAPLRPSAAVLRIVQDRARQKAWLDSSGFPVGPWRPATSVEDLEAAARALGTSVVKSSTGGYDGRSQAPLAAPGEAAAAWTALGSGPCVVERLLDLEEEISVLVARSPAGEVVVYPPALNHHADRILDWSVIPAPVSPALAARATDLGRAIALALEVEGLLAVEMFLTSEGELLVNELAPRPHNTFHHTEVACRTSQFEQAVRAVCDLPLGGVDLLEPVALVNLFGDLWLGSRPPPFDAVLRHPGVKLYLYGKQVARRGRKMGHLCAVGATAEEAVSRAREARADLVAAAGSAGERRNVHLPIPSDASENRIEIKGDLESTGVDWDAES